MRRPKQPSHLSISILANPRVRLFIRVHPTSSTSNLPSQCSRTCPRHGQPAHTHVTPSDMRNYQAEAGCRAKPGRRQAYQAKEVHPGMGNCRFADQKNFWFFGNHWLPILRLRAIRPASGCAGLPGSPTAAWYKACAVAGRCHFRSFVRQCSSRYSPVTSIRTYPKIQEECAF